jgi:hypothetical protein
MGVAESQEALLSSAKVYVTRQCSTAARRQLLESKIYRCRSNYFAANINDAAFFNLNAHAAVTVL